jgi:S1/P1 Nuclease
LLTFTDAKDSPPQQCVVNYPADCDNKPGEGCIISAIANQTALFMDPTTPAIVRQEALKFIVHFIGDLHQPLHTENLDRGGNEIPVCWRKACAHTNLHGVWDTNIPMTIAGVTGSPTADQERVNAERWAEELTGGDAFENVAELLSGECSDVSSPDKCSLEWAREVNFFNCKFVLQPSPEALVNQDLSQAYYQGAKPIVEYLIGKAGVRLAAWLEAMVANSPHPLDNRMDYEFEKVDLR